MQQRNALLAILSKRMNRIMGEIKKIKIINVETKFSELKKYINVSEIYQMSVDF